MPKLKTHKGAKSRFHITGSGKIMRVKGGKSHFRRRKPKRVRRLFDDTIPLNAADRVRIKRLLPYGVK
ncbi:MAG TPA: 50S ribosomal protein L35 [Dehalococcoidales bacterium]|nr:50S ribosomal protein L35 [Dehalococcoidales bacterium]